MRRRASGLVLALLAEALLIVMVFTLGSSLVREEEKDAVTVVRFKASSPSQTSPEAPARTEPKPQPDAPSQAKPAAPDETVTPITQPRAAVPPPSIIRLNPREMAAADISALPRRPAAPGITNRPMMGPPDTGVVVRDTARVSGSGPNGEPLYAASWYREPYDDELRGYLSTASGPGWGLIACRTAPDFRVEDCVKVDEYPAGSNIARAALAAAWQFQVRPPRIGGEPRIGEWVRIRIEYDFVARPRR